MTFPSAFFDSIVPMLLGERAANDVERDLGPCPSGTDALAFYAVLARRDVVSILTGLFVAARVLAERTRPALWGELVAGYTKVHRSTHWEPNRYAAEFPDFVAQQRAEGLDAPAALEEVADFELARFVVTLRQERTALVRQYDHDVLGFVRNPPGPLPRARTTVVAFHRDALGRGASTELGMAEIAALARRRGACATLPVEPAAIEAAERRLARLGVL